MDHFIKALLLKYESQKATAIAELSVLLQSPVGIGEHSSIIDEMDIKIHTIAEAEDCLEIVKQLSQSQTKSHPQPHPQSKDQ